ncbi:hypothetical protein BC830DRAFT_132622 [Chytriomyces sp. MP71]|nr:hypothetical protein BC830DRAFT_132622 [Chytriomyces sp. MP71]
MTSMVIYFSTKLEPHSNRRLFHRTIPTNNGYKVIKSQDEVPHQHNPKDPSWCKPENPVSHTTSCLNGFYSMKISFILLQFLKNQTQLHCFLTMEFPPASIYGSLIATPLGVATNLILLLPNTLQWRKLPTSSVFILCMSLGDVISCSSSGLISYTQIMTGRYGYYDPLRCQIQGAITIIGAFLALTGAAGLALFRFLIIVLKLKLRAASTIMYITAVSVITTGIIFSCIPFMIGAQDVAFALSPSFLICALDWSSPDIRVQVLVWLAIGAIVVPLVLVLMSYYMIYREVRKVRSDSNMYMKDNETDSNIKSADINQAVMADDDEKERKLLVQSIVIVTFFFLGWGTFYSFMIAEAVTGKRASYLFVSFAEFLEVSNSILNPFIVLVFDESIRTNCYKPIQRVKQVLCKQ